jgi:hypothetical protein
MSDNYNGWENYHTWNVALWINNEEPLYRLAVGYAIASNKPSYKQFVRLIGDTMPDYLKAVTPDGVSWTDPTLDHKELDGMFFAIRREETK